MGLIQKLGRRKPKEEQPKGQEEQPKQQEEEPKQQDDTITPTDSEKQETPTPKDDIDDGSYSYPHGWRLALVMTAMFTGMFLVALDKLIISTATPAITNEYHASNDIGWYGTAYLLTNCATLLVFGKLYNVFSVKYTFLTAVLLFEIGSAICGAAPSSIAFIIGRAIAGLGAGGVQSGVLVIIVYAVPLAKRPQYQGLFGAVYGVSSIIGPLLGGAFTTDVTWRWCFYINLPLGGLVMTFVFFLLQIPARPNVPKTLKEKLEQLNYEGLVVLVPGVICLCLALDWGGFTFPWSDGRIIALLTLAFVLLIAFVLIQIWRPKQATVPPHIFVQRSIWGAFWVSCCVGAHQTLLLYYLPVWFQAVMGDSAVQSGVNLLPQVIALVVASILTGVLTTKLGYYMPFLFVGICFAAVGAGLFTTLGLTTTTGQWIGFQILYGFGYGGCIMAPNVAAQTLLPRDEVSIGASLMLFGQTLFGAIFVSVGQNVLDGKLASGIASFSNITSQQIEQAGAANLLGIIPPKFHHATLVAYNGALRTTFQVGLIMACIAVVGAAAMEWRNVKTQKDSGTREDKEADKKADPVAELAAEKDNIENESANR